MEASWPGYRWTGARSRRCCCKRRTPPHRPMAFSQGKWGGRASLIASTKPGVACSCQMVAACGAWGGAFRIAAFFGTDVSRRDVERGSLAGRVFQGESGGARRDRHRQWDLAHRIAGDAHLRHLRAAKWKSAPAQGESEALLPGFARDGCQTARQLKSTAAP